MRSPIWRWLLIALMVVPATGVTSPLSPQARARLAAGQSTWVIVEFDSTATDRAANAERIGRRLARDDAAILTMRAQGYAALKSGVEAAVNGSDARKVREYSQLPLSAWQLSSLAALNRLEAQNAVRAVHANLSLHAVSVSDLPFISQPQTAAEGATGAGTTIMVIDGGLVDQYWNFADFGCTGAGLPASTCRVVYNHDVYPGASQVTTHGTNVSAIALGVAGGAKLAMYDVFNGTSASSVDVIAGINEAISDRATYNIVAINLSLGDGSSNSTQCKGSAFEPAIKTAYSAGILTVAAAGNSGSKTGLGDPACAPYAVSVGAVYDASYGTVSWVASGDPGGQCTDVTAADMVTCFSQSASYLSVLAPGSFVNAPNSSFQESGTSQATPHVSGSVAVLRARYPAESLDETVQRLRISNVQDTDAANGLTVPRLNLLTATNQGTAVALSGSGPVTAVAGATGTFSLGVTNGGPLTATNVVVTDTLPAAATFTSASAGCTHSGQVVTCTSTSLAVGATATFNIVVTWASSGAVFDSAIVRADQTDTSTQQTVSLGTPPGSNGDVPLPLWAYVVLGGGLFALIARHRGINALEMAWRAARR